MAFPAIIASVLFLGVRSAEAQPLDREAFLKAVAEVETGGNPRAIGRYGERGLYQFSWNTWKRHTERPFVEAHIPGVAHDVAVQHFVWLYRRLSKGGAKPTAYQLAVAWNGGLGRAISGKAPKSTRDYARRVSTLTDANTGRRGTSTFVIASAKPAASVAARSASAAGTVRPVQLDFTIDDTMVAAYAAPNVVPLGEPVVGEVVFSLAPAGSVRAAPPRRFFLATIGE